MRNMTHYIMSKSYTYMIILGDQEITANLYFNFDIWIEKFAWFAVFCGNLSVMYICMITIFCEKIVKTAISLRAWCKVVQDLYQAAETGLIT